jgi:AcrR family transcriptional regulator
MSPRPYTLGARRASTDATRARILAGARDLLMSEEGFRHFTIDAVARQADVARMTVYNQFKSRAGIFEAIADDIAARGKIRQNMARAFACEDAREGLATMIEAFVRFWSAQPDVMRKLHALSLLDPESNLPQRSFRMEEAVRRMLGRLAAQYGKPRKTAMSECIDALCALFGFSIYDTLAERGRSPREIVALLRRLAGACIDLTI